jgi:hypothetical protein
MPLARSTIYIGEISGSSIRALEVYPPPKPLLYPPVEASVQTMPAAAYRTAKIRVSILPLNFSRPTRLVLLNYSRVS